MMKSSENTLQIRKTSYPKKVNAWDDSIAPILISCIIAIFLSFMIKKN